MRALVFCFALVFGLMSPWGEASAQTTKRIALIIANETYASPNLGALPGTQTDANVMSQALARAGFAVKVERNLTRTAMQNALSVFASELQTLGPYGVGFLYYSGHGMADGPRGRNYLIPVDAHIRATTDLPVVALALDDQLAAIELSGAGGTIFVIDACRNTPVSFTRSGRGFAPMSAATDTLIAFSTQPGEIAEDDGLYARTLAAEIVVPGVDVATVFQRVQTKVANTTKRKQRPRYDNGLLSPLVLTANFTAISDLLRTQPTETPAPAPLSQETMSKVSKLLAEGFGAVPTTENLLRTDGVYQGDGYSIRFLPNGRISALGFTWTLSIRNRPLTAVLNPTPLQGSWRVESAGASASLAFRFDTTGDGPTGAITQIDGLGASQRAETIAITYRFARDTGEKGDISATLVFKPDAN